MMKTIGTILILLGLIGASGSAGDCDGHCMEYANDLQTFVFLLSISLLAMALGAYMIYLDHKYNSR